MKKLVPLLLIFASCHPRTTTLFERLTASKTGIEFNNRVIENDSINPLDMEFLYNGGGVAVGDFNNDSLPDLYFTASQVANELYLNLGDFHFRNITKQAGVSGNGRWSNAASVVDINNDGLQDIYVCTSIKKDPEQRRNLLYINQGVDKNGIPVFRDMAAEYHLDDTSFSVHAAFFDYDNDGDLDVYLVTTKLAQRNSPRFDGKELPDNPHSDKLFRNEGIPSGSTHPVFRNVSQEAGIKDKGYGLGIAVADLNDDGWKDIYVTNDFFGSDLLYINQGNGKFIDEGFKCLKHTSLSAMGNDVADINNDGWPEMIAVDMNPEDNYRKKKNLPGNNYNIYQNMLLGNVIFQYARNTLQLNSGTIHTDTSKAALPVFGDISFYAGVAETDWSWSPLFADFDNDGFKDLAVTNGYPKDVTDLDFSVYNNNYRNLASKADLISQIPQIRISNYAYRNTGNLKFENVTEEWGMKKPSFSNGAAYVDLDRDGDLDYVVNDINGDALVYRNRADELRKNNFVNIVFEGDSLNKEGLGAVVELHVGKGLQVVENYPYRGYLSSVEPTVHFGLGKTGNIDSIVIRWPSTNRRQVLTGVAANTTILANYKDAVDSFGKKSIPTKSIFKPFISPSLAYEHTEFDNVDFDQQQLLPHKLSEYGPSLAVGDVDGNGLEDLFVGGAGYKESYFFLARPDGSYERSKLPPLIGTNAPKPEVMGAVLFDADSDGDLDLYASSGSNELPAGSVYYRDRMFINDGRGNFSYDSMAIPDNRISKSCVKAADFDRDGDLDLFIGGRVFPMQYPKPVTSMILRNDSGKGGVRFTDVTHEIAPGLENFGLTCDALWSDFDNDGWLDLVIAGEWMPLSFFRNQNGRFTNVTDITGLSNRKGWWNSLAGGDFDNDGDIDYIAGNLGTNSFYRADSAHPATIYAGDFNKNGTYIVIPSLYLPDQNGKRQEYPAHTRNDVVAQLPAMKKKFLTYKSFAEASMRSLFPGNELDTVYKATANDFNSAYIENKGGGRFEFRALPPLAQLAPINGIIADDLNDDGNLDLVMLGNDYGTEVATGKYDAMHGLVLVGDGGGGFTAPSLKESGFYVPGNAKALVKMLDYKNQYLVAASQNRDSLKLFRSGITDVKYYHAAPNEISAVYEMKDGRKRKEEFYTGSSFLSQSGNFVGLGKSVLSITVINNKGNKRLIGGN